MAPARRGGVLGGCRPQGLRHGGGVGGRKKSQPRRTPPGKSFCMSLAALSDAPRSPGGDGSSHMSPSATRGQAMDRGPKITHRPEATSEPSRNLATKSGDKTNCGINLHLPSHLLRCGGGGRQ